MAVLPKGEQTASAAEVAPKQIAENGLESPHAEKASLNGHAAAVSISEAPEVEKTSKQHLPEQGTGEQVEAADIAAEVADSAEKIDQHVHLGPLT